MTIRLAIIGAGIMGGDHAQIFANDLPGAKVQVVCDASPDRAKALADAAGAVDVVSDAKAKIARSDVDCGHCQPGFHPRAAVTGLHPCR